MLFIACSVIPIALTDVDRLILFEKCYKMNKK